MALIKMDAMHTTRQHLPLAALHGSFSVPLLSCAGLLLLALGSTPAAADDWMTWPSTYTHNPVNGQRVDQYAMPAEPLAPARVDFQRSGYRHFRSTLQAGQSADNMHIVEQWGRPVMPYEQWRFPFRPYAVPYDAWGPQAPYGIINQSGFPGFGYGYPGYPNQPPTNTPPVPGYPPGYPPPGYPPSRGFPLQPTYENQPWYDGTYPAAPNLDPRSDQEFFGTQPQ